MLIFDVKKKDGVYARQMWTVKFTDEKLSQILELNFACKYIKIGKRNNDNEK